MHVTEPLELDHVGFNTAKIGRKLLLLIAGDVVGNDAFHCFLGPLDPLAPDLIDTATEPLDVLAGAFGVVFEVGE